MKYKVAYLLHHPFITGSTIMVFGSLVGNVFNFLFRVFMIKTLSVSEYGILATLVSLVTLPSLAALAIVPTVVRFASVFFTKGEIGEAKSLFIKVYKLFFAVTIAILGIFIFFTSQLSEFLHIKSQELIILSGVIVAFGLLSAANTAFLQAKLAFRFIVITQLFGAILKVVLGLTLVYLGFSVGGAMIAVLISFMLPYLVTFFPLRSLLQTQRKNSEVDTKELFRYGIPAAICMFGLTSLVTTDIILVKHFFSPVQAGIYAGLSLVAQIIFFISGPINSVLFPLIVQRHTKKERYDTLLAFSFCFVGAISLGITFFYFLFPQMILQFFFKNTNDIPPHNLLWIFGIYMSIYAVISLVTNFFLSIKKTKIALLLTIGAVLQALLLWFFHQTFLQIIVISIVVASLLLVALLLYYITIKKNG